MRTNTRPPSPAEWMPVIALPAITLWVTQYRCPPWLVMWSLAISVFFGFKWLTWRHALRASTTSNNAAISRSLAYLFAWPGMNANEFLCDTPQNRIQKPTAQEWVMAFTNLLFGIFLLWVVSPLVSTVPILIRGWIGLAGIVFLFHFGLFSILSCYWRGKGIQAPPLMRNPLGSCKLSEFWGSRWNTAFRDLTRDYLFRPLSRRYSTTFAVFLGFLASGLIHDLVISVPAQAGYGLPTLYFLMQGIGIQWERSKFGRRMGIDRASTGRIFAGLLIILPAGLLFHQQFIERIVLPFLEVLSWH